MLINQLYRCQHIAFVSLIQRLVLGALLAFDQDTDGAIRQFQQLQDGSYHPEIIKLIASRVVFGRIELCDEKDFLVRIHRFLKRNHRFVATNEQGNDHVREHHDVAQWQQWQRLGFGGRTGFGLGHFHSNILRCNSASIPYMVAVPATSSGMRQFGKTP